MTSIQENLARVRSSLAAHDSTAQHHADILDTHAAAIREHEAHLRRQRDRSSRKRKHDPSDLRFRFKRGSTSPSRKARRTRAQPADDDARAEVEGFTSHPLPRAKSPSLETPAEPSVADPDAAFTASLFDALADDEGAAAYWEAVYAQPVHVYSRPRAEAEQGGELEEMNDDEYAAYVKRKMWEKMHPEEMREIRLRQERRREKEERQRERDEWKRTAGYRDRDRSRERARDDVQAALDRGAARKETRAWGKKWDAYQERWRGEVDVESIPWPTEGGTVPTEDGEEVRMFFKGVVRHVLPGLVGDDRKDIQGAKMTLLKAERFRWHPDKMMQRFGEELEKRPEILAMVTGVFQVVDSMLGDMK